jgi:protein SCO1/2
MVVRDDGQTVSLKNELDDGRPVVLTFIYTACTSICPVTSQTLSQLQSELGRDRAECASLRSRSIRTTIRRRA